MTTQMLIDSSFLVAMYDQTSRYHTRVLEFGQQSKDVAWVPNVALTEVVYLLQRDGGIPAATQFLKHFRKGGFRLLSITMDDLASVEAIMGRYASANFDFVDCCIMTLAERLNISRIGTLDRRDFSVYRPTHCDYFELLP